MLQETDEWTPFFMQQCGPSSFRFEVDNEDVINETVIIMVNLINISQYSALDIYFYDDKHYSVNYPSQQNFNGKNRHVRIRLQYFGDQESETKIFAEFETSLEKTNTSLTTFKLEACFPYRLRVFEYSQNTHNLIVGINLTEKSSNSDLSIEYSVSDTGGEKKIGEIGDYVFKFNATSVTLEYETSIINGNVSGYYKIISLGSWPTPNMVQSFNYDYLLLNIIFIMLIRKKEKFR